MTKILGFNESQYDRIAAMLRAYESGTLWPSDKPRNPPRYHPENHIRFHNDSGEAIPPFAVMRITGVNSSGVAPWRVNCGKPNDTFYNVYLVNSAARCTVSDNGWGTYLFDSGHVLCDDTYVPTVGQEWGPASGSWALVRHRPGFLIDGGPTGSGDTYRAVAKQRIVTTILGDLVSDLNQGSSSGVNVFFGNAGTGTLEDSGLTITAYDWFLGSGESWDATTRVKADFYSGRWWITQAACSPDSGGGGGGGGGGAASQSPATLGAGVDADMQGTYYPGGLDYGQAYDPFSEPDDYGTLLGV